MFQWCASLHSNGLPAAQKVQTLKVQSLGSVPIVQSLHSKSGSAATLPRTFAFLVALLAIRFRFVPDEIGTGEPHGRQVCAIGTYARCRLVSFNRVAKPAAPCQSRCDSFALFWLEVSGIEIKKEQPLERRRLEQGLCAIFKMEAVLCSAAHTSKVAEESRLPRTEKGDGYRFAPPILQI